MSDRTLPSTARHALRSFGADWPEWARVAVNDVIDQAAEASQPVLREALDAIEKALAIGGTSYDGDSWYAHDAGLGTYDEMDAALAAGREALATLRALASRLSSPEEKR